jgi:glycosyltransferase involved in cell wall biosynthesis
MNQNVASHFSISVFFPFYNDENTVRLLGEQALEILREVTDDYEVILVNDGSEDKTGSCADDFAREHPGRVRVIHHERNKGYGGALRSGFAASTKEWVFYTDGDAQYDLNDLASFLEHIGEADVINGYKIKRADGLHRAIIGRAYHWTARFLFGIRMHDIDCDFRLMRREIFNNIELRSNTGVICVEMMKLIQNAGYSMIELPVRHQPRRFGKSQFFKLRRIIRVGFQLIGLFFRLRLCFGKGCKVVKEVSR